MRSLRCPPSPAARVTRGSGCRRTRPRRVRRTVALISCGATSLLFLRPSGTLERSRADGGHVDELPFRMQDRMLLVAEDPRLHQLVAIAADVESPRRVRLDDLRHLVVQLVALG